MKNKITLARVLRALFNPASIEDADYYTKKEAYKKAQLEERKLRIQQKKEKKLEKKIKNRKKLTMVKFFRALINPSSVRKEFVELEKKAIELEKKSSSSRKMVIPTFTFQPAKKLCDTRTSWTKSALQSQMLNRRS
ncbi:MAG: hypothetical protein ACRC5H_09760 [Treponemataceae bacterium]